MVQAAGSGVSGDGHSMSGSAYTVTDGIDDPTKQAVVVRTFRF